MLQGVNVSIWLSSMCGHSTNAMASEGDNDTQIIMHNSLKGTVLRAAHDKREPHPGQCCRSSAGAERACWYHLQRRDGE